MYLYLFSWPCRCLRNKRPSKPYGFYRVWGMHVTKPYKSIWFDDMHAPTPCKGIASIGQTLAPAVLTTGSYRRATLLAGPTKPYNFVGLRPAPPTPRLGGLQVAALPVATLTSNRQHPCATARHGWTLPPPCLVGIRARVGPLGQRDPEVVFWPSGFWKAWGTEANKNTHLKEQSVLLALPPKAASPTKT